MASPGARRAVDREHVAARQHRFRVGVEDRALLERGRQPRAVAVMDRHVEAARAFGERAADAPHAEDPQPLAADLAAQHLRKPQTDPAVVAYHALAFAGAPGGA